MSGVGFGLGMERIIAFAEQEGIILVEEDGIDCYVMPLSDKCQVEALRLVTELRANGYQTEMDYASRSMKAQFKTVDRKQAKTIVIIGEDELAQGVANIKDIASQTQITVPLEAVVAAIDLYMNRDDVHTDVCDCGEDHDHDHHHHEHNHDHDHCHCGDGNCDCGDDCNCGENCNCSQEEDHDHSHTHSSGCGCGHVH